jgi:hypothetical protein
MFTLLVLGSAVPGATAQLDEARAPAQSTVQADLVASGQITATSWRLPAGRTLWLAGELVLEVSGEVLLQGEVRGLPGNDAHGASLGIRSDTLITVTRSVLLGDGRDGTLPGQTGSRGGDLLLSAPLVVTTADLVGGDGGHGGPGAAAVRAGHVRVEGAILAPRSAGIGSAVVETGVAAALRRGHGGNGNHGTSGGNGGTCMGGGSFGGHSGNCCLGPDPGHVGGAGGDGGTGEPGVGGAGGDGGDGGSLGYGGHGGIGGLANGSDGNSGGMGTAADGITGPAADFAGADCPAGAAFTNLGGGTGPALTGDGTLLPGSANSLEMEGGLPGVLSFLAVSGAAQPVAFKGGWLYPQLTSLTLLGLPNDSEGGLALDFTVDAGWPSALSATLQWLTAGDGSPLMLSNSLRMNVP